MLLSRRDVVRMGAVGVAGLAGGLRAQGAAGVEQWGVFEVAATGPTSGNPFVEVEFGATFQQGATSVKVDGFYDGGGWYKVRFMPPSSGVWTYLTHSNRAELEGKSGSLTVVPPGAGNHGPVRVRDQYRFVYADGTPYREVGTTCYAWTSQPETLEEQTLRTLGGAPFNKLRMCVFPKWFNYNRSEPPRYAFEGTAPNRWDFSRFNPEFFGHLERRIGELGAMGIEADLILFHPYDGGHWGFDNMGAENDERYLKYVIARLGAYRNVWWSLANEWDYFKTKTVPDWMRIGETIHGADAYGHLCSIHNQTKFFDHTLPWITHVSVQNDMPDNAGKYLRQYGKPVIFDECW